MPMLEVLQAGPANAVQDAGRLGHRAIGVPVSGAADPVLLACANALLGNAPDAAGLELPLMGPTLRAIEAPVRVALAGAVEAALQRADGQSQHVPSNHTVTLHRDDVLRVGAVMTGVAYLALAGGCQVPLQLGSRSTYARAHLGGVQGRALAAGDLLACAALQGDPWLERRGAPWQHAQGPIRVMLGPQDDAFTPQAIEQLLSQPFQVTRECDRMGMRLEGPQLTHRAGADITSDGVVPGAIQVPGNGAPIILFADAQTVGGYAKIATVIRADLPRLAHMRPGLSLRFEAVTRAQALQARDDLAARLAQWQARIETYLPPGVLDVQALHGGNLVSGMINANTQQLPWD